MRTSPACVADAHIFNEKRFLSLDLTYGHPLNYEMYQYLLDNGVTQDEYHWFVNHHRKAHCVMGNDYYVTNEHLVQKDGSVVASGEIFGYYVITHQYFSRYRLPVMHTETNLMDARSRSRVAAERVGECVSAARGWCADTGLHLLQLDGSGRLGHGAP